MFFKNVDLGIRISMALTECDIKRLRSAIEDVRAYDDNRISVIRKDVDGAVRDYGINDLGMGLLEKLNALKDAIDANATIKVVLDDKALKNRLETAISKNIKDIHVFISNRGSTSFEMHQDDESLVLFTVSGSKALHFEDSIIVISTGEALEIPKGMMHSAETITDKTVMLSIGIRDD